MATAVTKDGLIDKARKSVRECLKAYGNYREAKGWFWHKNLKPKQNKLNGKESEKDLLLPTLEAVSMYLEIGKISGFDSLQSFIKIDSLLNDVRFIVKEVKNGFSALPYLSLPVPNMNFVEVSSKYLSVIAALSRNDYLIEAIRKGKNGEDFINEILESVRLALNFIEKAVKKDKLDTSSWAASERYNYTRTEESAVLDLTHTYYTMCALTGLVDILMNAGSLLMLKAAESDTYRKLVSSGLRGLNSQYDDDSKEFFDNKTNRANDIIPTAFALEAIFQAWDLVEVDILKEKAKEALLYVVERIGANLKGLSLFDRQAPFQYVAKSGNKEFPVAMEDHTTIGTIANILCYGLDYLSVTDVNDNYYAILDGVVEQLLNRRDKQIKVWKTDETAIWYSSRAIESLVLYIQKREIVTVSASTRALVAIISNALRSERVIEAIAGIVKEDIKKFKEKP